MKTRRFGRTGLDISILSFGGMRIVPEEIADRSPDDPWDEETALETIKAAVAFGINHIETARGYGRSEELIGKVMPDLPRDRLIINTKATPRKEPGELTRIVEEEIERLRCGRLDLFAVHGINSAEILSRTLTTALPELRRLQDQDLIGPVGFSTHAPLSVIEEAIATDEFDFVNLHYFYLRPRNRPAVLAAAEHDMGVFIISPQDKGGSLYSASPPLAEAAAPFDPVYLAGRWLLAQKEVHTLSVGASRPEHFERFRKLAVNDGPLTEEEKEAIHRWDALMEGLGGKRCDLCGECLPCPEGINIPEMLHLRNLLLAFGMKDHARNRLRMLEPEGHWFPGTRPETCTRCGECEPRCPLEIPIVRQVGELVTRI